MTIYIRPDGTISGSNEPLPEKPKSTYIFIRSRYDQALTAWMESCKEFEDQEQAIDLCRNGQDGAKYQNWKPTPDTIIENVDVEMEVVRQFRYLYPHSNIWHDTTKTRGGRYMLEKEYRTVLRIKDKP